MNANEGDHRRMVATDRLDELLDYAERQASRALKNTHASASPPLRYDSFHGYSILERIRAGGQGTVFKAIHESTNRTVAIKVTPEAEASDPAIRARYAREVEILAQLRHPHIVRLTDGGNIDGRFFFVTDFVDGEPLDAYLRHSELDARDDVRLFVTICEAVNAAHLRGIVHRDLKPSNILADEHGKPHVLDFGLAKLIAPDGQATHWRDMTITGQFVGTLPWSTPEQVRGNTHDVDIRTDVYALGILLYHALTGRFPYDVDGSPQQVMSNILDREPLRPSSTGTRVDHDLETIILKSLSKEPERRYQSAGELARDLQRYLAGDPLEAKRDSALYVLSKTLRRHRRLFGAVLLLITLLVAYAVTTTVLLQRARFAERSASEQAERARARFRQSRETIDFVLQEIMSELDTVGHVSAVREKILAGAYARLKALAEQDPSGSLPAADLANVYARMADIAQSRNALDDARAHVEDVLAIRRRIAEDAPGDPSAQADLSIALVRVGDVGGDQGDAATQKNLYERALTIDLALVQAQPNDVTFLDNLGWSYDRLGNLAYDHGDFDTALAHFTEQTDICESIVASHPEIAGKWEALRIARRNLSRVLGVIGHISDSTENAFASLEAARTALQLEPDKLFHQRALFEALSLAAAFLYERQRTDDAMRYSDEALAIAEALVAIDPEIRGHHAALAHELGRMALWARSQRRFIDAEQFSRRELEVAEALSERFGTYGDRALYMAAGGLGDSLRSQGRLEEALPYQARAVETGNRIVEGGTDIGFIAAHVVYLTTSTPRALWDPSHVVAVAKQAVDQSQGRSPNAYYALGLAYQAIGDQESAAASFEDALALLPDEPSLIRTRLDDALAQYERD